MERTKTDFLRELGLTKKINSDTLKEVLMVMQAYANQQVELAVDIALQVASENGQAEYGDILNDFTPRINKQSILSLKPQILEELRNG